MELTGDVLREVLEDEPDAVRDYREGSDGAMNYLVGCVLQKTAGTVNPMEAKEAIEEHLSDDVVEVRLYYEDYYNTSEKISQYDNIPDTQSAWDTFKYPPCPHITFEWDKKNRSLEPVSIEICDEEYELQKD